MGCGAACRIIDPPRVSVTVCVVIDIVRCVVLVPWLVRGPRRLKPAVIERPTDTDIYKS